MLVASGLASWWLSGCLNDIGAIFDDPGVEPPFRMITARDNADAKSVVRVGAEFNGRAVEIFVSTGCEGRVKLDYLRATTVGGPLIRGHTARCGQSGV